MASLKDLQKHRKDILLAEVAAWLHDVGKLHLGHQAKWLKNKNRSFYNHTRFGPGKAEKFLYSFSMALPQIHIMCTQTTFQEIIRNHHKRIFGNCKVTNNAVCLIQRVDWLDSEYDRSGIITRGSQALLVQPTSFGFGVFSVFGYAAHLYKLNENSEMIRQRAVDCSYNDILTTLLCSIKSYLLHSKISYLDQQQRKGFLEIIQVILKKAAGDTRYSVNDIALWEHSWSVSVLTKSFVAWGILNDLNWESKIGVGTSLSKTVKQHAKFTRWFRPQLLPLRIDGLTYLAQSNNIPDLLARRELLTRIYDTSKDILEWEFPLAGEVYRDENGPVFLTFLRNENGQGEISLSKLQLPESSTHEHIAPSAYQQAQTLEDYLRQVVVEISQGDLTLSPQIPFFTYSQKSKKTEREKSLDDLLAAEQKQGLWSQADVLRLQEAWKDVEQEICSMCGLRPQGYGRWLVSNTDEARHEWIYHYQHNHRPNRPYHEKTEEEKKCQVCKAISRKMCGVCLERRVNRAKIWAQGAHKSSQERFWNNHPETVWLDEVADANGRLALIVGYFPLEHWLDGILVESLAMFKRSSATSGATNHQVQVTDETGKTHTVVLGPKPVSYSRIRRIWETTRRFWQDVAPTDAPSKELRDFCHDNKLDPETLWEGPLSLEASVAGKAIAEKRHRIFLQAESVDKLAKDLGPFHAYEMVVQGRKVAVLWVPPKGTDAEDVLEEYRGGFWVIENLDYLKNIFGKPFDQAVQTGDMYEIYEPSEYGRPGRRTSTFALKNVVLLNENYTPLVPILAEPRIFMALVPADKALEVVRAIKIKYEREMGKVRNRLPLHLGIVFADAHQPLRIILDAGRRMLKQEAKPLLWEVICLARKQIEKGDSLPSGYEKDKEKQFKEWYEILLESREGKNRKLIWYVPALMGDGQTEDFWYLFTFLKQKEEPKDREIYYRAHNPWNADHSWLVHVSRLKPGDIIYFIPATLDFIWLDHSGTRFEIVYGENSSRLGTLHRPYLLDELGELGECWKKLEEGLSLRQILRVRNLIETNRAEWFENPRTSIRDEMFRKFCRSVLVNAEWKSGRKPDDVTLDRLTHWAVTGFLADTVELHHHIMKHKTRT